MSPPEPITISRAFAWIVGGISSVAIIVGGAATTALWNQAQAITRMETRDVARSEQLTQLTQSIHELSTNHYSSTDASTDRASIFQVVNTLTKGMNDQVNTISDLRVKVATLEARGHP